MVQLTAICNWKARFFREIIHKIAYHLLQLFMSSTQRLRGMWTQRKLGRSNGHRLWRLARRCCLCCFLWRFPRRWPENPHGLQASGDVGKVKRKQHGWEVPGRNVEVNSSENGLSMGNFEFWSLVTKSQILILTVSKLPIKSTYQVMSCEVPPLVPWSGTGRPVPHIYIRHWCPSNASDPGSGFCLGDLGNHGIIAWWLQFCNSFMVRQLRGIAIAQKKLRHGPAHGNLQLKSSIFPGNHPQNRLSSAAAFHELHTKAPWHVDPAEAWQVEWSPSLKVGSKVLPLLLLVALSAPVTWKPPWTSSFRQRRQSEKEATWLGSSRTKCGSQ